MKVRWIVELSETERDELEELISSGTLGARVMKRALILLRSDDGWTAEQVSDALSVGTATVYRRRQRYVEVGLPEALHDRHRPGAERKLDALQEATLVALACSDAPEGRAKWTMQLLADELVALTDVDELSKETVRRRLAEKKLKPWQRKMWCIPAVDAEFVARMEDVLDLYAEPYDPRFPVVNFDETPIQLIGETRVPVPAAPGRAARVDYEYRRHGTANLFVAFDRHQGWRNVNVTERRTIDDFAEQMRQLVDVHYPDAERIRVVLDNLNTHRVSALYDRFEPEEARRIASCLEFHFTPKHASWLNMVEIEIGVLSKQCLDRRIASIDELTSEVGAWQDVRNAENAGIDWLFDVTQARAKLGRHYPIPTSREVEEDVDPAECAAAAEVEADERSGVEVEERSEDEDLSVTSSTRPVGTLRRLWRGVRCKFGHDADARETECG
jgi:transposase